MKTERTGKHITLHVSVWIQVEESQLDILESSGVPYRSGRNYETGKLIVGLRIYSTTAEPKELVKIDNLYQFLTDFKTDSADVNLVVTMISNSSCSTVDIPDCINDVVTKIGCKLIWSYTII